MQIRPRIFKHTAMQVLYFFSRQNLQTFDISHAFLSLTVAKLSTFKNGPVFLAHPVYKNSMTHHKQQLSVISPKIHARWDIVVDLLSVQFWQMSGDICPSHGCVSKSQYWVMFMCFSMSLQL